MANTDSVSLRPPNPLDMGQRTREEWEQWIDSFEWYAVAIQLGKRPPEVQAATLMSVIGPDARMKFKSFGLTATEKKDIGIIKHKFKEYFEPKVNYVFERNKFNKLIQREAQMFNEFEAEVKTQAARCNYGTMADELVRDRIIEGVRAKDLQERLLMKADITLIEVIDICRAYEQAQAQAREIAAPSVQTVDTVRSKGEFIAYGRKNLLKTASRRSMVDAKECGRCGRKHGQRSCPEFDKSCNICKKKGHFARKCRARPKEAVEMVEAVGDNSIEDHEYFMSEIRTMDLGDWYEEIYFSNGQIIKAKLDSGAQCNTLRKSDAEKIGLDIRTDSRKRLTSYSKHELKVYGEAVADVVIREAAARVPFVIIDDDVTPVLGRRCCEELNLIRRVHGIGEVDIYKGIGLIKGFEYEIDLKKEVGQLQARPPRRVPFPIRDEVKKELDRMVKDEIIESVNEPTPMVSQMVVVRQKGKLRICLDPSDLNKVILRRHYPLRTLEEVVASVKGARYFTVLDLKKGFWQLAVSRRTSRYLAFSTPWGRYCFKRLPFGIASAPEIFQCVMANILDGIAGVINAMDDLLIFAKEKDELSQITETVMKRLLAAGVRLNKDKCVFAQAEVTFLGHILTSEGLKIDARKVEAIGRVKQPQTKAELRRFLGMVVYHAKFIPHLSALTENFRVLLRNDVAWSWTDQHAKDFEKIKRILQMAPMLRYYDVNADNVLSVDASASALGAALIQDGRVVAYASTALSEAQCRYPQIEKEALAMRFACTKFHQYIYGRPLIIETDHKPLEVIYKKPLSKAPARLQRIIFEVQPYSPVVHYRRGKELVVADLLSRDCLPTTRDEANDECLEVHLILQATDDRVKELKSEMDNDTGMRALRQVILSGWPSDIRQVPFLVRPYVPFRDEMSVYDGLIFRGERLLIPPSLRQKVLRDIHVGHLGVQSCLKRAREAIFWPRMSSEITALIQRCAVCQSLQDRPPKEPLLNKPIPASPWERVATDLFDFSSEPYIVLVDSFSGFVDFKRLRRMSAGAVIVALKEWFSVHGIPLVVESDNGPCYSAGDFKNFAAHWGFRHETSSPYYPRGNGLAERAVRTAKNLLKKCKRDNSDIHLALLALHNVPRDQTLGSPSERLFGRRIRDNLPTAITLQQRRPWKAVRRRLRHTRRKQTFYADRGSRPAPDMKTGDKVRVHVDRKWVPATVLGQATRPRSLMVDIAGKQYERNTSVIRPTQAVWPTTEGFAGAVRPALSDVVKEEEVQRPMGPGPSEQPPVPDGCSTTTRYGRVVKPPVRLML